MLSNLSDPEYLSVYLRMTKNIILQYLLTVATIIIWFSFCIQQEYNDWIEKT